jgi:membrane protein DedA with SNARE-associated domain
MSAFWENLPYLAILFWLIVASLGFPLPEDILLLTGGYLCYEGHARLGIMMIVGFVGVLAGDCILYGMGRLWGVHIVEHRFVRGMVSRKRLRLAEKLFAQHGVKILFFGRFLPGLRPVIFAAAGVLRVPPLTFATVNGLAACISVPLFILLGNYFGHNIEQIKRDVRTASHLILFTVLVIILIVFVITLYRRQRRLLASVEEFDARTVSPLEDGHVIDAAREAPLTGYESDSDHVMPSEPRSDPSRETSSPTGQARAREDVKSTFGAD